MGQKKEKSFTLDFRLAFIFFGVLKSKEHETFFKKTEKVKWNFEIEDKVTTLTRDIGNFFLLPASKQISDGN